MIPSVGRIVHYVAFGTPNGEYEAGKHRAAIITEVFTKDIGEIYENVVSLCVFHPTGMQFVLNVTIDPTGTHSGSWHWPER
jgi:hypothetical protein